MNSLWRSTHSRNTSRMRLSDLVGEASAGISQRPTRAALTTIGTILGIGSFVVVIALTATAQIQIDSRFTALVATEIIIDDAGGPDPELTPTAFPEDADARIQRVDGVSASGVWWTVATQPPIAVDTSLIPRQQANAEVRIVAASAGLFDAIRVDMKSGRTFDFGHVSNRQQVAVLGASAAKQLGITDVSMRPAVFVGEVPFSVIGIIGGMQRQPELLSAVLLPGTTVADLWGQPTGSDKARMLIETRPGAAGIVASQAALAIRPDATSQLSVSPPVEPRMIQNHVGSDLQVLFLFLAGMSLMVGAVGIANTTMVGVLERASEIGLRRALGGRKIHIAAQFLTESGALGLLGGIVGTSAGIVVVVTTSILRGWTPLVPTWTVIAAPLIGSVVGLLAGSYPAVRAARIEPVAALRR
jgi:putative ABC transport system permease protein